MSGRLAFHVVHAYHVASLTGLCHFACQIALMHDHLLVDLPRGALTDQRCYTMVRMHPPVQVRVASALTKVQCPCQGMPAICSLFCAQACHSSDASCMSSESVNNVATIVEYIILVLVALASVLFSINMHGESYSAAVWGSRCSASL